MLYFLLRGDNFVKFLSAKEVPPAVLAGRRAGQPGSEGERVRRRLHAAEQRRQRDSDVRGSERGGGQCARRPRSLRSLSPLGFFGRAQRADNIRDPHPRLLPQPQSIARGAAPPSPVQPSASRRGTSGCVPRRRLGQSPCAPLQRRRNARHPAVHWPETCGSHLSAARLLSADGGRQEQAPVQGQEGKGKESVSEHTSSSSAKAPSPRCTSSVSSHRSLC